MVFCPTYVEFDDSRIKLVQEDFKVLKLVVLKNIDDLDVESLDFHPEESQFLVHVEKELLLVDFGDICQIDDVFLITLNETFVDHLQVLGQRVQVGKDLDWKKEQKSE